MLAARTPSSEPRRNMTPRSQSGHWNRNGKFYNFGMEFSATDFPIARWEQAVFLSDKSTFVRQKRLLCEAGGRSRVTPFCCYIRIPTAKRFGTYGSCREQTAGTGRNTNREADHDRSRSDGISLSVRFTAG